MGINQAHKWIKNQSSHDLLILPKNYSCVLIPPWACSPFSAPSHVLRNPWKKKKICFLKSAFGMLPEAIATFGLGWFDLFSPCRCRRRAFQGKSPKPPCLPHPAPTARQTGIDKNNTNCTRLAGEIIFTAGEQNILFYSSINVTEQKRRRKRRTQHGLHVYRYRAV